MQDSGGSSQSYQKLPSGRRQHSASPADGTFLPNTSAWSSAGRASSGKAVSSADYQGHSQQAEASSGCDLLLEAAVGKARRVLQAGSRHSQHGPCQADQQCSPAIHSRVPCCNDDGSLRDPRQLCGEEYPDDDRFTQDGQQTEGMTGMGISSPCWQDKGSEQINRLHQSEHHRASTQDGQQIEGMTGMGISSSCWQDLGPQQMSRKRQSLHHRASVQRPLLLGREPSLDLPSLSPAGDEPSCKFSPSCP